MQCLLAPDTKPLDSGTELLVTAVTLQLWGIQTELRKAKVSLSEPHHPWCWRAMEVGGVYMEISWFSKPSGSRASEVPVKIQMPMGGAEQWVVTYYSNLSMKYFIRLYTKAWREQTGDRYVSDEEKVETAQGKDWNLAIVWERKSWWWGPLRRQDIA